ncbi:Proteinase inhibitor I3 [Macleaya cordata]|uniref:Proteinase inhibitor I3 n=1 Tax=Macleaya cordata TaxID=56857 RepID=A0A200QJU5_MACCD|nr:Proteinase inhibitor I3 [Macleaya cordata]
MRSPSFLVLLSLFLFAFSTTFSPVSAESAPEAVRDTKGDKLRAGVNYYILPVVRGSGGGLKLGTKLNGTRCPLDVVQEQHEVVDGLPLTFTPVDPKKGVIRVSTDQNIKFSAMSYCVQSTVWRLSPFDESTGKWFITTSGVEGNPGIQTVGNWFKIEKDGDRDYKLVHCPMVCNFCKVICKDVGIFIGDDGVRRLALTDDTPFKVMFKKA